MKMHLVAVWDKKAKEYSPPQAYVTLGVAERAFTDAVNNEESHLNRHPDDYSLQLIGDYNTETGEITGGGQPRHLFDAVQLLKQ